MTARKITIDIGEDDYNFLVAMTGFAKMKVVDLNEHDGYRIVNHSVKSLVEAMVHRSVQAGKNETAKAAGINPNPF